LIAKREREVEEKKERKEREEREAALALLDEMEEEDDEEDLRTKRKRSRKDPKEKEEEDEEEESWRHGRKAKKKKKAEDGREYRPGLKGKPDEAVVTKRRFWSTELTEENIKAERHEGDTLRAALDIVVLEGVEKCPPPVQSWEDERLPEVVGICMAKQASMSKTTQMWKPSTVQAQCWPAICSGYDVLALAETGSGKTLGYLLPAIPHIKAAPAVGKIAVGTIEGADAKGTLRRPGNAPVVLTLVPTRELAMQVVHVCRPFKKSQGVRAVAVFGGQGKSEQVGLLEEGVEVVAATPGRLLELLECRQIDLGHVSYLVLDEADKMLEMGFESQLDKISGTVRDDRQMLLFSATFPKRMDKARLRWLKEPIAFRVGGGAITFSSTTTQIVKVCPEEKKYERLIKFLTMLNKKEKSDRSKSRVMVFTNRVQKVTK